MENMSIIIDAFSKKRGASVEYFDTEFKFRRATHDVNTNEYIFKDKFPVESHFQKLVWDAHGDIAHHLSSDKGMTFQELLNYIRKDDTNYNYSPSDLENWQDGGDLPKISDVALSLVRLLQAGFVEMIPTEKAKNE